MFKIQSSCANSKTAYTTGIKKKLKTKQCDKNSLIAFYRQVTKFGGQHYLAPFFKVFVVVVPVDVKADGVALNAVVRRVID